MIYLLLFAEFFKVGLFSVGGGLATIPFLNDLGARTGWFSPAEMANMIAISESTPGPMGVNMGGVPGGVIATLGLVCPAIIIIAVIAGFLKRFRESRIVDAVFYGLRPASTALIAAALVQVCSIALVSTAALTAGQVWAAFNWKGIVLAAAVFVALRCKALKKLHPIVFIGLSAVVGIVWKM